jgi:hypothetical protein
MQRKLASLIGRTFALWMPATSVFAMSDTNADSGIENVLIIVGVVVAVIFLVRKMTVIKNVNLKGGALLMDFGFTRLAPFVRERIPRWNLEDQSLLALLGYILGYLDAAYQNDRPKRYDEKLIETWFHASIERFLKDLPGVDDFLKGGVGGSFIAALQCEPSFMKGQLAGGQAFAEDVRKRPGHMAGNGLFRLLGGFSPIQER